MSDATVDKLPLEIWQSIFSHLGIPDILRVRTVSPLLNAVGHSRSVWSDAYRRVTFIRPPGPFPSQSVLHLEHALACCFKVDRNLRRCSANERKGSLACKLREIRYTGIDLGVSLVFIRFLLVAFKEEIRCYDLDLDALDSNSGASIIYRPTDALLQSFYCASSFDINGQPFASIVVSEIVQPGFPNQGSTRVSIYSLKIVEPPEVFLDLIYQSEYSSFLVDEVDLGPRVLVVQGEVPGPGEFTVSLPIAVDLHTRTQFLLPSSTQMWSTPEVSQLTTIEEIDGPTSISTSTHVLLAGSFYSNIDGYYTIVQAFPLPPIDSRLHFGTSPTSLSPSHRGIIPGIVIPDTPLLHDTIIDASTQDVLIMIRVDASEPSRPRRFLSKYGNLRLSSIYKHIGHNELSPITFHVLGSLPYFSPLFPRPSLDGTGRAFFISDATATEVKLVEYDICGNNGGNEGDDHAVQGYNDPNMPVIKQLTAVMKLPTPPRVLDYDPYSGRICLRLNPAAKYRVIEVFDFSQVDESRDR